MWADFHRYNEFVKKGYAEPFECEVCGAEMVTRIQDDSTDLYLWCPLDGMFIKPGLDIWHQVKKLNAVIQAHLDNGTLH